MMIRKAPPLSTILRAVVVLLFLLSILGFDLFSMRYFSLSDISSEDFYWYCYLPLAVVAGGGGLIMGILYAFGHTGHSFPIAVVWMLYAAGGTHLFAAAYIRAFINWNETPIVIQVAIWVYVALSGIFFLNICRSSRGTVPPAWWRALLSYPSHIHSSTIILSILFLPFIALIPGHYGAIYVLAVQCIVFYNLTKQIVVPALNSWDVVEVSKKKLTFGSKKPTPITLPVCKYKDYAPPVSTSTRYLRIVQISDVHIGSMFTVSHLYELCQTTVQAAPDFVFITGDMLTMEGPAEAEGIRQALTPLQSLAKNGRVFACLGNHEKETPAVYAMIGGIFSSLSIQLLIDDKAEVDVAGFGKVEIVGIDFVFPWELDGHVKVVCDKLIPHEPTCTRIILQHDPTAFKYVPGQCGAIVLSGHTHGGHVGLYSLGLRHFTMSRIAGMPDNGPWINESNFLYVHRAQGSRLVTSNEVIRIGVPPEYSVMMIENCFEGN